MIIRSSHTFQNNQSQNNNGNAQKKKKKKRSKAIGPSNQNGLAEESNKMNLFMRNLIKRDEDNEETKYEEEEQYEVPTY